MAAPELRWAGTGWEQGTREPFRELAMFSRVVTATWECTLVKSQIVELKLVHFILCKLYHNKADLKNIYIQNFF